MKKIETIEDVREYIQQDYWESGKSKGVSGYEKFDIPFDVVGLPTRDRSAAVRMLKHKKLESTGSIRNALKRARHKY